MPRTRKSSRLVALPYRRFCDRRDANTPIRFDAIDYALLHAALFHETNEARRRHGVPLLSYSEPLERAASLHSRDMAENDFFSHKSPVAGRRNLADRLKREELSFRRAGENLLLTFGIRYESGKPVFAPHQTGGHFSYEMDGEPIPRHTGLSLARQAVGQWMGSSAHRGNLLDREYSLVGFGAMHVKRREFQGMDCFLLTQNFIQPWK